MSSQTTPTYTAADRPAPAGPPPRSGTRTPLRILAITLALLLVAYGAVVLASLLSRETRTSTDSFDGIRTIQLDTSFESVDVVASDGTTVNVDRRWTWSLKQPSVRTRQVGDRLVVSSSCPFSPGLPCTGRVQLVVPADVAVLGGSSDGHLLLSGLTGPLDVHNADGGVELRDVTGRLRLSTSDGSVRAEGLASDQVTIDTADGSVQLSFATPPRTVRASTSDGSLEIVVPKDGTAYAVSVSVSDGSQDVDVPTDPESSRTIDVHTSDGSVRILPAG